MDLKEWVSRFSGAGGGRRAGAPRCACAFYPLRRALLPSSSNVGMWSPFISLLQALAQCAPPPARRRARRGRRRVAGRRRRMTARARRARASGLSWRRSRAERPRVRRDQRRSSPPTCRCTRLLVLRVTRALWEKAPQLMMMAQMASRFLACNPAPEFGSDARPWGRRPLTCHVRAASRRVCDPAGGRRGGRAASSAVNDVTAAHCATRSAVAKAAAPRSRRAGSERRQTTLARRSARAPSSSHRAARLDYRALERHVARALSKVRSRPGSARARPTRSTSRALGSAPRAKRNVMPSYEQRQRAARARCARRSWTISTRGDGDARLGVLRARAPPSLRPPGLGATRRSCDSSLALPSKTLARRAAKPVASRRNGTRVWGRRREATRPPGGGGGNEPAGGLSLGVPGGVRPRPRPGALLPHVRFRRRVQRLQPHAPCASRPSRCSPTATAAVRRRGRRRPVLVGSVQGAAEGFVRSCTRRGGSGGPGPRRGGGSAARRRSRKQKYQSQEKDRVHAMNMKGCVEQVLLPLLVDAVWVEEMLLEAHNLVLESLCTSRAKFEVRFQEDEDEERLLGGGGGRGGGVLQRRRAEKRATEAAALVPAPCCEVPDRARRRRRRRL